MASNNNRSTRAPSRRIANPKTARAKTAGRGKKGNGSAKTANGKNSVAQKKIDSAVVSQTSAELMSDNARESNANGKRRGRPRKAERNSIRSLTMAQDFDAADGKNKVSIKSEKLSADDLSRINTPSGLMKMLKTKNIKLKSVLSELKYEEELVQLQIELVKLQRWAQKNGKRIAILFEGRDAAGKGGAIRRFTEHLNPRSMRVVALPKPSEVEQGQWYFQRYSVQLPSAGEIVFFDRSWYNRAVVEPVNGFCTDEEYDRFMQQVTEYEHMLYEDGIMIIKFWFSISREEQKSRFNSRRLNPLKQWKLSPIDDKAQELWEKYSRYKELMFSRTHTSFSPWIIVQANNKKKARLESIRYVLSTIEYAGKGGADIQIFPDPNVVSRFHRNSANQD